MHILKELLYWFPLEDLRIFHYSMNANTFGTTVGNWVVSQFLDGIDFDLENLAPYVAYPPMTSSSNNSMDDFPQQLSAKTAMGPNSFITLLHKHLILDQFHHLQLAWLEF